MSICFVGLNSIEAFIAHEWADAYERNRADCDAMADNPGVEEGPMAPVEGVVVIGEDCQEKEADS